jgi:arylsulfatase A-like enzyme
MATLAAAVALPLGVQQAANSFPTADAAASKPNIVFVLTDDMSSNLLPYVPEVQKMQAQGMTFNNHEVSNSLCCPSRSSIFTGQFPHNTGVLTNEAPDGGFGKFHANGDEKHTFATALHAKGYRTAMMGKYLNGYKPTDRIDGKKPYVPPGWSQWNVVGPGYEGYHYKISDNHRIESHGGKDKDYLNTVLTKKGKAFIKKSANAGKPFLLELAPFTPHSPSTPAPQDENALPGLKAPRSPAFNKMPANAPSWLAKRDRLGQSQLDKIDRKFRKRAQSMLAINRMLAAMRTQLTKSGVANRTYVVFTSDNGFHLGEYQLQAGKQTAFDTDIKVPLVVTGPGVAAGSRTDAATSNIDFAPTFERMAGATVPSRVDGHSMLPLLADGKASGWRQANMIEHRHVDPSPTDPDSQQPVEGNPPSYHAMRTRQFLYVEYAGGAKEYYDLSTDPNELDNIVGRLATTRLKQLHKQLTRLENCHGDGCWKAGHL